MKVLIVLSVLLACVYALPVQDQFSDVKLREGETTTTFIPILKYNREQGQDGSYKTQFETGNNIIAEEAGYIKDINEEHPSGVLVQHGQYTYTAPDGEIVNVQYIADEQGFRATGDHIPKASPPSAEIQKSLDQIYAGIEAKQARARSDPEYAKQLAEQTKLDYTGQYYPQ